MQQRLFASSLVFLLCAAALNAVLARPAGPRAGARMLRAANELLSAFGEEERKKLLFDYGSDERFNWHFIPKERKGLALKDMKEEQRSKVTALLAASLSEAGVKRAQDIMGLEEVLREIEGPTRRFPRDPLLYHVWIFGTPSKSDRWGWRFEGHHLSMSFTLNGTEVLSATPIVHGANPALVKEGPKKGLRVLGNEEDLARAFVTLLDESQIKLCKGEGDPEEVPGTEKAKYTGPFPAGITGEKLTAEQKEALRKLLRQYATSLEEESAGALLREAEGDLKDIHFAWRGGLKAGVPHSYMAHSSGFMINYINAQNDAAHIHSCLRLLKGEFGL